MYVAVPSVTYDTLSMYVAVPSVTYDTLSMYVAVPSVTYDTLSMYVCDFKQIIMKFGTINGKSCMP